MYVTNGGNFDFNDQCVESDNESEGSYSDLINDYAASKLQVPDEIENNPKQSPDLNENLTKTYEDTNPIDSEPNSSDKSGLDDMLLKSQKLLHTIEEALNRNVETAEVSLQSDSNEVKMKDMIDRKLSDRSSYEDSELRPINVNLADITKWAAQLLLALEKLHVLGVICW